VSASTPEPCPYVGRGGIKLAHALREFGIKPGGFTCADFGCNVGGFSDCLLQAGAARVYALDTGYGALAWRLRQDPRVVVMERTNAMHAPPPTQNGVSIPVHLIAMDLGWTRQRHAVPAALRWLAPAGRIISLIKPHYELQPEERPLLSRGVLAESDSEPIARRTVQQLAATGVRALGLTRSPLSGGAGKGNKQGNAEWLVLLERAQ
jgi:23S rRNA (cytidine1920-2'-O)/16S rRNA (cytidine1409-2'-O)-methyltransferase